MKIIKIFCNICGEEIDFEKDKACGHLEIASLQTTLNMSQNRFKSTQVGTEIVREEADFCDDCVAQIKAFINKTQEEKKSQNKKVENTCEKK